MAAASDINNCLDIPLNEKLRDRRKMLGLTMKVVAEQAGLSVGFISQIERGVTTPSLSSLTSVCAVLRVDIADFLKQPKSERALSIGKDRETYAVGKNTLSYERISSAFSGHTLNGVIITDPPGHKGETNIHDGEELLYILEGALTIELDGIERVLIEGDSIHYKSTRPHRSWNHTHENTKILTVCTLDIFGENPLHKDRN
ncbi:MAG: helix-turn-helix transcriptional regulator [Rhizobiales bacterium]|nr:helix-turn-helix transcriptional regulator [Hyphomicrobiales bacterium]